MSNQSILTSWLSRGSAICSVITCYGALAVIALLGSLGISMTLNETAWAGLIVLFASVSVFGLVLSWRQHHNVWPLLLGCLGCGLITYVMTIDYRLTLEILGFVLLGSAVFWDWKLQKYL